MKRKYLPIAGIALLGGVALVGGTVAFLQDSTSFDNNFTLGVGETEYVETFKSPENWKSCDETQKELVITNNSDVPVYARFKIEDYWKRSGSTDTSHTSELSRYYNGEPVAIISFQNQNDWEQKGDWYEYKTVLQKNQSTSSMLKSVTYNCNQNFAGEISYSADGKTGTTVIGDYDNATYHLFVTAQTIAKEQKASSWSMTTWAENWKDIVKQINGGVDPSSTITSIVHENSEPADGVDRVKIYQLPADDSIVAWLTDNASVLHYYSAANEIYFPSNSSNLFSTMTRLESVSGLAGIKTTNVTNMNSIFYNDEKLSDVGVVSNWDVSKVTNFGYSFFYNNFSSLEPFRNWDISSATNLQSMFRRYENTPNKILTTAPVSGWNVKNVTNFEMMFYGNPSLDASSLDNWNINLGPGLNRNSMFDPTATKPSWYN